MKLPKDINHFFPEISLSKESKWNDLKSKIEDHIASLDDNPKIYIENKKRELWNMGNNIFELGFETEYKFGQRGHFEEREAYKNEVNRNIKNIIVLLDDIDLKPSVLSEEYDKKNIQLDLTQPEILGIMKALFSCYSKNKVSNSDLFRFCSQNFTSKNSKEETQTMNSYKESYYAKLVINKSQSGISICKDEKQKIIAKTKTLLDFISNQM